jgi:hypothetical protein
MAKSREKPTETGGNRHVFAQKKHKIARFFAFLTRRALADFLQPERASSVISQSMPPA